MKKILSIIHDSAKSLPGGIEGLADKVNQYNERALGLDAVKVKKGTFSNKCNPNNETHHLNILELLTLMHVMREEGGDGHVQIIHSIAHEFGYQCEPMPQTGDQKLTSKVVLDAYMAWDKERGDTYERIRDALSDGRISDRELREIQIEMTEDIDATMKIRDILSSLNKTRALLE